MMAGEALHYEHELVYSYPDNRISCSVRGVGVAVRNALVEVKKWKIDWTTLDHGLQRVHEVFPGGEGGFTLDGQPSVAQVEPGVQLFNISATGKRRIPV